jgi:ankyrin repeat protein
MLPLVLLLLALLMEPMAAKRQKRCDFKTVQMSALLADDAEGFSSERPLLIQGAALPSADSRTRDGFRAALGAHVTHPTASVALQSEIGTPPAKGDGSSFSAWLDTLDDDAPPVDGDDGASSAVPYLFHVCSNYPSCDAALVQAYGVPSVVRHLSRHLFVAAGKQAKGLPLHAHEATWALALSGKKNWFVAPPRELPVRPHTHFSEEFLAKVPELQRCAQREGEIVYLPAGWWHATFAKDDWTLTLGGQGLSRGSMYHAARGDVEALQKASVTAEGAVGASMASAAAEGGHTAVLKYLAAEGVDLSRADEAGKTPTFRAVQNSHADVLDFLASQGVSIVTEQPSTLHQACVRGNAAVVELLLAHGADAQKTDGTGALAANVAAEFGQVEVLRVLGAHGVNMAAVDAHGMNTAHAAGLGGHPDVLKYVGGGGKVEASAAGLMIAQDKKGKTCGHYAAERGHLAVLRYLTVAGLDLSTVDQSGASVAHIASYFGHAEAVGLLLEYAPQLFSWNAKDGNGATAYKLAKQRGHTAVLDQFRAKEL